MGVTSDLFQPLRSRSFAIRYAIAIGLTALALVLTLLFPDHQTHPLFFFFMGAMVISTWYAGIGPGVTSLALSIGAMLYFILPPSAIQNGFADGGWRYVAFFSVSLVLCALTAVLRQANEALHNANLRFGGVVELSEDAIISVDEQQNITLFNAGAEKIFGYKEEEILGKPLNLLLPERFRGTHAHDVRRFGTAGDALRPMNERGLIFGLRRDGREFPAEASISKFEIGGELIMTVRLRDITERVEKDRVLRELAAIVESSDDAIIGEDFDGYITAWNSGAEKIFGYEAGEVIGKHASILLPAGSAEEVPHNVEAARTGSSVKTESVRVRKDGKRITVALTVSPIKGRDGEPVGVATVGRDITEHKRLEEQFRQSQKMEAVGRLAGGIAHDFNNILSVIIGYTYLIQANTSEGDPIRQSAEQVMTAAEKASSLTRQLLAFSRRQVLQPEIVDLNDILGSMGKMLTRLIGEDIEVKVVEAPGLKSVKADPSQIEQIVMNLVVNARDAMPDGGRLTIETANVHFDDSEAQHHGIASGDYVLLAVTDTGIGMEDETRAHIFEPFFTTKDPGKGTGLGLATVYGVVKQSGGHIWVYSEPGHGTTFKIYMPIAGTEAGRRVEAGRPQPTVCGSETVLVVEDESDLRSLVNKVLSEKGYKVLTAIDGRQAVRIAGNHNGRVDLLLTDVVMPGMSGQQLAEELTKLHPHMQVVYMSGYTDNALMHSGSLEPGMMFLQKPFTPDVILRKVRSVLDQAKTQRESKRRAV